MLHVFKLTADEFAPKYLDGTYVPGRADSYWYGALRHKVMLPPLPEIGSISDLLARHTGGTWTTGGRGVNPGFNLTFSAPKGLSIAALLSGDARLLDAHEDAVAAALSYIERNLTYRETKARVTSNKPANGILSAVFHRCQSRAGDPLLHSQALLFGFTQRDDGVFCALDVTLLYHAKLAFGMVYRSEMARLLSERRIHLAWDGDFCDLEGIPESIKKRFSARSRQIDDLLEKNGIENRNTSPKHITAVAVATAQRRVNAQQTPFEVLRRRWIDKWPAGTFLSVQEHAGAIPYAFGAGEFDAIMETFEQLAHGRTGIARHILLKELLAANQGYVSVDEIEGNIDLLIEEGQLIEDGFPKTLFTPERHVRYLASKQERKEAKQKAQEEAEKRRREEVLTNRKTVKVKTRVTFAQEHAIKAIVKKKRRGALSDLVRKSISRVPEVTVAMARARPNARRLSFLGAVVSERENALLVEHSLTLGVSVSDVLWAAICLDNELQNT